ncbi:hypothetical protein OIU77_031517 [Salix suchowensis]|uniref:Uncharacterized protein n=1 Tax=Salix suchowensis TaxID=1278906 RepID=A0ABQ9BG37_9ROSI|nr:hypothetical protein OIU77_031517 [Salix suchowensis]
MLCSISISLQNGSERSMQARRQIVYLRGHRTPHVLASKAQGQYEGEVEPPEKIALEVENQSEVKVEPKLQRSVTFPLSSAAKRTSDHRAPPVPPEEIALEVQKPF